MAQQTTAIVKKEVIDLVESRIKEFQADNAIHFPENYSPQNALKSAWLILQETKDREGRPALEVCTKESIANALLNTVIQGLSPAKKQVYLIVYGSQLAAQRSYHGTQAVTKRLTGVKDVFAEVIYEGDDFAYTIKNGNKIVIKHEQSLANIDENKIVGAYCTILYGEGKQYTEIMTKKQLDTAFSKTKMKVNNVQKEFASEMSKRSVINRTCKAFVNTSDDSDLLIQAFHNTGSHAPDDYVEEEIATNANKDYIDVEARIVDKPEPTPGPAPAPAQPEPTTQQPSVFDNTGDTEGPGF